MNREIVQLDIATAFLEIKIREELHLRLLKELGISKDVRIILKSYQEVLMKSHEEDIIGQLNRSLYCLRQAGRNSYATRGSYLTGQMGMQASKYEGGLYTASPWARTIA